MLAACYTSFASLAYRRYVLSQELAQHTHQHGFRLTEGKYKMGTKRRILAAAAFSLASFLVLLHVAIIAPAPTVSAQNFTGRCDDANINKDNCAPVAYVQLAINILSAAVGVIVVIMVAVGGVQYTASKDNPQQTAAAKERIRNALLALVAYIFMFAFLQWLVPGGIF